ncbi:transcription factor TFIIIB subunit brf1 [Cryptotrichosporon argae]
MAICPLCGPDGNVIADHAAGNTFCTECGTIVDNNIYVSEVGFAEGAGGRMHQQGTTIGFNATGVTGSRGNAQSTQNIIEEGKRRIANVCEDLGITILQQNATRMFQLAVDNRFNRGRRSEFVIASCVYLASRIQGQNTMLIDLSERLKVNVYELGATYSKLLNTLKLQSLELREVDPANYNLRFANKLQFDGQDAKVVAADASRLVKRFQADWMSSGRRPAGICGACLVIAARMNNYLRTPEEVAQVVKVSPDTIRRRLVEFAQTDAANKTVNEWRAMTDEELSRVDENELPPVTKQQERARAKMDERARLERRLNGEDEEGEQAESSASGAQSGGMTAAEANAVRAAALGLGEQAAANGMAAEIDDDQDLDPLGKEDFTESLMAAGTSAEEQAELKRHGRQLKRDIQRSMKDAGAEDEDDAEDEDLDALAQALNDAAEEGESDPDAADGAAGGNTGEASTDLAAAGAQRRKRPDPPDWTDEDAVIRYFDEHHLKHELAEFAGDPTTRYARIKKWLHLSDPEQLSAQLWELSAAHWRRNQGAKVVETVFADIDDADLDKYWVMADDERDARARMWLSANGRWLEEDKERQAKKREYEQAHGPAKPRQKRARRKGPKQPGVHKTAGAAIRSIVNTGKGKTSSRINYAALNALNNALGAGLGPEASASGLQIMDEVPSEDEKEDEADEEGNKDDDNEYGQYDEYEAGDNWQPGDGY